MFIRSERLFLRPSWPEDWEELHHAIADEGVVRNLAQVPWPYHAEDAREFARREQAQFLPHFVVTLPGAHGARVIGCVGLSGERRQAELGYWITRSHWGQGYASEAARAVLRLADALGHRRIFANHFSDNPASGRVLEKAGFRRTGEVRPRFSAGRGAEALSIRYVRDAEANCAEPVVRMMCAA